MEKEQEIMLHITKLSPINQKLMTIILHTMLEENYDGYDKLAQIFYKRAEMTKLTGELLK